MICDLTNSIISAWSSSFASSLDFREPRRIQLGIVSFFINLYFCQFSLILLRCTNFHHLILPKSLALDCMAGREPLLAKCLFPRKRKGGYYNQRDYLDMNDIWYIIVAMLEGTSLHALSISLTRLQIVANFC